MGKLQSVSFLSYNLILLFMLGFFSSQFCCNCSSLNLDMMSGLPLLFSLNEKAQGGQMMQTHKMSKVKWSFVPLAPSFITTSWSKINVNFLEDLEPQITLQPTWSSGAYLLVPRRGNYHFHTLLSSTSDTCWEGEESGLKSSQDNLGVNHLAQGHISSPRKMS